MKVRIKRDDLFLKLRERFKPNQALMVYDGTVGTNLYNFVPEEIELEVSESDIVKEKSNLEMWEEIFFDESRDPDEKAYVLNCLDYDATQAYEKIVEGK